MLTIGILSLERFELDKCRQGFDLQGGNGGPAHIAHARIAQHMQQNADNASARDIKVLMYKRELVPPQNSTVRLSGPLDSRRNWMPYFPRDR